MARRQYVTKKKNPLIVICSEGGNNTSEKVYFSNYRSRNLRIQFSRGNSTDADGMLKDLLKYIKDEDINNEDRCEIFILLDTDLDNQKIEKIINIQEECKKANINIITSSPTFEIWYLMHFRNNKITFSTSSAVKKELNNILNGKYVESLNMVPIIGDKFENAYKTAKTISDKYSNNEDLYYIM